MLKKSLLRGVNSCEARCLYVFSSASLCSCSLTAFSRFFSVIYEEINKYGMSRITKGANAIMIAYKYQGSFSEK